MMGVNKKPRWKAYLWVETNKIARLSGWGYVEYETKENAVRMARKSAASLFKKYRSFPNIEKPTEEQRSDGSVIFRIPGMNEDRWPKVTPI
jgi:hypothetical protein